MFPYRSLYLGDLNEASRHGKAINKICQVIEANPKHNGIAI